MRNYLLTIILLIILIQACGKVQKQSINLKVRKVVDTVGFAHLPWQLDSIIYRINSQQANELERAKISSDVKWRVAICPHDDYTYVGWHYPAILQNIKAKTVIIFGVAHKAKRFNLTDKIVFDNFDAWQSAYGNIPISSYRNDIYNALPSSSYTVHDSMHIVEHSIESMLPFLQYFNRKVEIIPVLVPYMNFQKMKELSQIMAESINSVMQKNSLSWGDDIALLITTDAVHYGDEEWGGKNYAPFGVDVFGYSKAVEYEYEIIRNCLEGEINETKIKRFVDYTVSPNDYREYQWTWCGRYCLPLGLLTSLQLNKFEDGSPLNGCFLGYSNSIDHKPIPVDDLGMGTTAIATPRHWVGYASLGYK